MPTTGVSPFFPSKSCMNVNTDNIANTLQGFSVSPLRPVWRRPCGLCLAALRWRKSQTSSSALLFFSRTRGAWEMELSKGRWLQTQRPRPALVRAINANFTLSVAQQSRKNLSYYFFLSLFLSSPHTPALFSLCVVILRLMMQGSQGFNRDRKFVGEKVLCSLTSHQVIAMGHVS